MDNPLYPRGSEWRKWDLQIHTPFSALNNGFGNDFDAYAKEVFARAVQKEIAVVGVTDYFCIEGYTKLREILDDEKRLSDLCGDALATSVKKILFLPNIELRTSVIVRDSSGHDSRVNFHVVLSPTLETKDIGEHFLRELKFTVESNLNREDESWSLTLDNLEEIGRRLKAQHKNFQQSDLYVGMLNAVIDHKDVSKVLENKASIFRDKYLLCTPADEDLSKCSWDGQGHLTRKLFIQKSHFLFSSNAGTREFALGERHPSAEEFTAEFKSLKPCMHSSDAHSYDDLFEPDDKRYTWIKADPTFAGLRQVLNEPKDRIWIGDVPPSVTEVGSRSTRYAIQLAVGKVSNSSLVEKWFDTDLLLNSGLIVIIGNKGSGKSALADILGLLGNTPRSDSFSFLREGKFCDLKNNKARYFEASLTWADGNIEGPLALDTLPTPHAIEKIKYIPQDYLETICNEVQLGKSSQFYSELQQVIFSHVLKQNTLGCETLDELLDLRTEQTQKAIGFLIDELREINRQIAAVEEQMTERYKKRLEAQLDEKRRQLAAHQQTIPPAKTKPQDDPTALEQSKATTKALEVTQKQLEAIEELISRAKKSQTELTLKRSMGERLVEKIKNLQRQVEAFLVDAKNEFDELALVPEKIVSFSADIAPIENIVAKCTEGLALIAKQFDETEHGSYEYQKREAAKAIAELQSKLSAPEREFQEYLLKFKRWEQTRLDTVGDTQVIGSLRHLEHQQQRLQELPRQWNQLARSRNKKALEIYKEKQKLRQYYADYYGEVQGFLSRQTPIAIEQFKLEFSVSIVQSGFEKALLEYIHQGRLGSFFRVNEGGALLRDLLAATDFDSPFSTLRLQRRLVRSLREYEREGRIVEVAEQLVQGVTPEDLYNYIFSLDYLSPSYNLRWDGKDIDQLSPGERGNLLLIFYLLADQDNIPLVIDQPEENLDNQTIFRTLVPCVRDAKKRRQLIMVTHNPNLAVACDAEQVICAEIKKDGGNEVLYTTGSIEDPIINKRIVDILEGTRPAFDKRDATYQNALTN